MTSDLGLLQILMICGFQILWQSSSLQVIQTPHYFEAWFTIDPSSVLSFTFDFTTSFFHQRNDPQLLDLTGFNNLALPYSTLILLENCSCCDSIHSDLTAWNCGTYHNCWAESKIDQSTCLLRFPSHTRSTRPPAMAIFRFTLFANSTASSSWFGYMLKERWYLDSQSRIKYKIFYSIPSKYSVYIVYINYIPKLTIFFSTILDKFFA